MPVVPIRELEPGQKWATFGSTEPTHEFIGHDPEPAGANHRTIGNGDLLIASREIDPPRRRRVMRVPRDTQVQTFE